MEMEKTARRLQMESIFTPSERREVHHSHFRRRAASPSSSPKLEGMGKNKLKKLFMGAATRGWGFFWAFMETFFLLSFLYVFNGAG